MYMDMCTMYVALYKLQLFMYYQYSHGVFIGQGPHLGGQMR